MRISDWSSDVCSSDLGWLMVMATIWVLAFFRDPVRAVPQDERAIVAPADGLVTLIQRVPPPREMAGPDGLGDQPMIRVLISMSMFDVHINRTSIGGTVTSVVSISGTFLTADLDKANAYNERPHYRVALHYGENCRALCRVEVFVYVYI